MGTGASWGKAHEAPQADVVLSCIPRSPRGCSRRLPTSTGPGNWQMGLLGSSFFEALLLWPTLSLAPSVVFHDVRFAVSTHRRRETSLLQT